MCVGMIFEPDRLSMVRTLTSVEYLGKHRSVTSWKSLHEALDPEIPEMGKITRFGEQFSVFSLIFHPSRCELRLIPCDSRTVCNVFLLPV